MIDCVHPRARDGAPSKRFHAAALDRTAGDEAASEGEWGVVRFAPDGSRERVVWKSESSQSDGAIGGHDGHTLFETTARHDVALETLDDAPLSGRLFVVANEPGAP